MKAPAAVLTTARRRRAIPLLPSGLIALLVGVVLLTGCSAPTGDLGTLPPPPATQQPSLEAPSSEPTPGASMDTSSPAPTETTPAPTPTPRPTRNPAGTPRPTPTPTPAEPVGTTTLRAYFFLGSFGDNEGLAPVLRVVPKSPAVGAAAVEALLKGPNNDELGARPAMYTSIPDGTRLLGLRIDNGIATVDLSSEFAGGGGSASVLGRLAQVVYTLTQFQSVDGVKFELDGVPVTNFSGEGVVLSDPVDRGDYTDQLPAVFVDRPAWGGAPPNPARIVGLANVFEGTFQVRLLDGDGGSLADAIIVASCGTGCWGSFNETVPYTATRAGWGTLQVTVGSAGDGSPEILTEYPVWLTP